MTELAKVKLGSVGEIDLEYVNGVLKLSLAAGISTDQILTLVENAIPGDLDNKLIDGLKALLAKI